MVFFESHFFIFLTFMEICSYEKTRKETRIICKVHPTNAFQFAGCLDVALSLLESTKLRQKIETRKNHLLNRLYKYLLQFSVACFSFPYLSVPFQNQNLDGWDLHFLSKLEVVRGACNPQGRPAWIFFSTLGVIRGASGSPGAASVDIFLHAGGDYGSLWLLKGGQRGHFCPRWV